MKSTLYPWLNLATLREELYLADRIAEQQRCNGDDNRCLRKAVRCEVRSIYRDRPTAVIATSVNGPAPGIRCKNIVGGCGCIHAEPRAMDNLMDYLDGRSVIPYSLILLCTYAPCYNCALRIDATKDILFKEYKISMSELYYLYPTHHDPHGLVKLKETMNVYCLG